ncbi:triple tyrosine motif-containing protein [Pedobacter sp. NJ-S-72]
MYFGSVKGLISFLPNQLSTTSKTAPLFLTGFKVDNTEQQSKKEDSVLQKSILYTNKIILKNSQSSFNIDFAALSYFSPEKTEYAYKISGLFNDWQYLKTNRKIYFTKLAPGEYVFEAKAMIQGSREWSKNNIKLLIIVLPPFWKSPAPG